MLKPKCIETTKPLAFTSYGYLLPCCWCDKRNARTNEKEGWNKFMTPDLHLDNAKVNDVLQSKVWNDFHDTLTNNPENAPNTCKKFCGNDEYEEISKVVE